MTQQQDLDNSQTGSRIGREPAPRPLGFVIAASLWVLAAGLTIVAFAISVVYWRSHSAGNYDMYVSNLGPFRVLLSEIVHRCR